MRTSVAILTFLLVSSLLLVAGCAGGEAEAPVENVQKSEAPVEKKASVDNKTGAETTQAGEPQATATIINSAGERVVVRTEIADTQAEQQRGLMERTELAEDAGMLFVFPQERPRSFWMRNTLIPLSIAYIDSDGRIVDIKDMQPLDETSVPSAEPAQYALEVNQGFFEARGIEVGNTLELPGR